MKENTVAFDAPCYRRLKNEVNRLLNAGYKTQHTFEFEGNTYVLGYAKYLVEYLALHFEEKTNGQNNRKE